MLENSKLVDGQDAKELNRACKEYNKVTSEIKDLETTKKKNAEVIKKYCNIGAVHETTEYIVTMAHVEGRVTISASEVEKKAPELFRQLLALDLVKVGDSYLQIKSIKHKE